MLVSRRKLLQMGGAAGVAVAARPASAANLFPGFSGSRPQVDPALLGRAKAALDAKSIRNRDVIGIADFSKASRDPRFYLVDLVGGMVTDYHVAHGRGSDPDHSGWVERFSNDPGSEASSNGAYITGDIYYGKYGRSLRLTGLDGSNSNALARAIVVHAAWYAKPEVAEQYGKLGRSEGCFALSETNLQYVLFRLGSNRLLYADKLA